MISRPSIRRGRLPIRRVTADRLWAMASTMLARLDSWIGRELVHPPVTWLCQRTGMTQYAVARYGWMLATWTLVMRISFEGLGSWLFSVLVIGLTVIETARAAMAPNALTRSSSSLRLMILLFAVLDVVGLAMATAQHGFLGLHWGLAWDVFAIVAEYAKTITTIPPAALKRPATRSDRRSTGRREATPGK